MSVRVNDLTIVYESVTMTPIVPNTILNAKKVFVYCLFNSVPKDEHYTPRDLLWDAQSDGMWTLPESISWDMREFIADMVQYFL